MDEDVLQAKWKYFRNEIHDHWSELGADDLDQINGRDGLVLLLESKYGYAHRRAEREVERVVTAFENKLRRAL
jgi:hypothetical protein